MERVSDDDLAELIAYDYSAVHELSPEDAQMMLAALRELQARRASLSHKEALDECARLEEELRELRQEHVTLGNALSDMQQKQRERIMLAEMGFCEARLVVNGDPQNSFQSITHFRPGSKQLARAAVRHMADGFVSYLEDKWKE